VAYLTGQVLTQADIAALFTSGTYTPTLGNMAIGTGGTPTNTASYTFVGFPAGGVLTVEGSIKFGTTAPTLPGASVETISLPSGYTMINTDINNLLMSQVIFNDVSAGAKNFGVLGSATTTTLTFYSSTVSGTLLTTSGITAAIPFAWAVSDEIFYRFSCRCTGP
jgi:hypothetical protein